MTKAGLIWGLFFVFGKFGLTISGLKHREIEAGFAFGHWERDFRKLSPKYIRVRTQLHRFTNSESEVGLGSDPAAQIFTF
ncbi:hypothetical protein VL14_05290 [Cytobacillus firmus]|nr:hypothetical protein VL14_05290 [Cytobacillus firmus]